MIVFGISAFSHDAAISVFDNKKLVFASHSERFNKIKNSENISNNMIDYIINKLQYYPDKIYFYENPYKKALRQLYSGQYDEIPNTLSVSKKLKSLFPNVPINYVNHHESHALLSKLSKYDNATVVVIDAIGEFVTTSIWKYNRNPFRLKCLWRKYYPTSLGLLYSAFTQRIGLKPNEHEYITMAMASFGKSRLENIIEKDFFNNESKIDMKVNTHRGISNYLQDESNHDIAYGIQKVIENKILLIMEKARKLNDSSNLVYCGGVALNCVANSLILKSKIFDDHFIFPNPGDAGSSVGCALKEYKNELIHWDNSPYLGYDIKNEYPTDLLLNELLNENIVGVANGKAEFGPRALGNRSILADPRSENIKDKVNEIKHREPYRPFAPVILKEHIDEYFNTYNTKNDNSYMQYVYECKYPNKFPGICHIDNTSRVQTITYDQNPGLYTLIKKFYSVTNCPMLLNTSLNIKGQPIVNDENDAYAFEKYYNIKVF